MNEQQRSTTERGGSEMTSQLDNLHDNVQTLHKDVGIIQKDLAEVTVLIRSNAEQTHRLTETVEKLILNQAGAASYETVSNNASRITSLESKAGTLDKGTIGVMATIALIIASLIMVAIQWKIAEVENRVIVKNRENALTIAEQNIRIQCQKEKFESRQQRADIQAFKEIFHEVLREMKKD